MVSSFISYSYFVGLGVRVLVRLEARDLVWPWIGVGLGVIIGIIHYYINLVIFLHFCGLIIFREFYLRFFKIFLLFHYYNNLVIFLHFFGLIIHFFGLIDYFFYQIKSLIFREFYLRFFNCSILPKFINSFKFIVK